MRRSTWFHPLFVLLTLGALSSLILWLGVYPPRTLPHGGRIATPLGAIELAIEKSDRYRDDHFPGYYRIGFFRPTTYPRWEWGGARIAYTQQYFHDSSQRLKLRYPIPMFLKSLIGNHLCWGFPQATITFAVLGVSSLLYFRKRQRKENAGV